MHSAILAVLFVLFTAANVLTSYLYLYPTLHNCSFPDQPERRTADTVFPTRYPPFRLLVLADPQLEGDSSIPHSQDGGLQGLWSDLLGADTMGTRFQVTGARVRDILQVYRKKLDLLGNDYYLAHIYRTLLWTLLPTHTVVLGDLIGSQWVSDEEFERRGARYWQRVFQQGTKVADDVTGGIHTSSLEGEYSWSKKIISVAGNHDVGYAGDMTSDKVERFERVFGKANWETRFNLPLPILGEDTEPPELRLVILNSLNLDGPAFDRSLQDDTHNFLQNVIASASSVEDRTAGTILLTHLPLYKEAGVCVDGPLFTYHDEKYGGGIREQNHLTYDASKGLLEGVFGMSGASDAVGQGRGRKGIILTGHDHEGCDVYHHLIDSVDPQLRTWTAEKWHNSSSITHGNIPGIREITVRSMMGDFGGNAGLLSAWFDPVTMEWEFEYSTCALGKQHIWWAIHILDIVTVIFLNWVGWTIFRGTKDGNGQATTKEKMH